MDGISWIAIVIALAAGDVAGFIFGTRARAGGKGSDCVVDEHWFFGWWVRCKGGASCPTGEHCTLLQRKAGTEEEWQDAGVIPGGSVKWQEGIEYRCVCRAPAV